MLERDGDSVLLEWNRPGRSLGGMRATVPLRTEDTAQRVPRFTPGRCLHPKCYRTCLLGLCDLHYPRLVEARSRALFRIYASRWLALGLSLLAVIRRLEQMSLRDDSVNRAYLKFTILLFDFLTLNWHHVARTPSFMALIERRLNSVDFGRNTGDGAWCHGPSCACNPRGEEGCTLRRRYTFMFTRPLGLEYPPTVRPLDDFLYSGWWEEPTDDEGDAARLDTYVDECSRVALRNYFGPDDNTSSSSST
jgi:hypothetical protein